MTLNVIVSTSQHSVTAHTRLFPTSHLPPHLHHPTNGCTSTFTFFPPSTPITAISPRPPCTGVVPTSTSAFCTIFPHSLPPLHPLLLLRSSFSSVEALAHPWMSCARLFVQL